MTEYANNVAKISWDESEGRFELRILNKLKAYSEGASVSEHEEGKKQLVELAKERGYTVILA